MTATPRPRSGVHLLPLEPGAVLFCELSQNLYALNGAAALVWCGLEDGFKEDGILAALIEAGAPAGDAPGWYRQSIEMFGLRGLLEGTRPPDPPPVKTRAFGDVGHPVRLALPVGAALFLQAFDSLIELRLANPALRPAMEEIFARLVIAPGSAMFGKPADVTLGIGQTSEGYVVTKSGIIAASADLMAEMACEIERDVIQLAVERASYLLEIRGAVMERRGSGFLFAAPSGSGKTTLAAGLMRRGWGFGSDERALLSRGDLKLRAAPLSLRLNRGSWPVLAPLFAELETNTVYGRPDRPVRYLAPPGAVITEAAVDHVVFPQFRSGGATALRPVRRHEGLQELFANCTSVPRPLTLSDIIALVEWSGGVAFHRLEIADLAEALDVLEGRF
jgi:hypothetical protein